MKPIKRQCPVCHMPVKVAHVDVYENGKVRKCYCVKCGLTIRTVQKTGEEEKVYQTWYTHVKRKVDWEAIL